LTIALRHLTGVVIKFQLDGKPLSWEEALQGEKRKRHGFDFIDYDPELIPRGETAPEGFQGGWGSFGDCHYICVDAAGDYRIQFPPIRGFEPIPSRDVTIVDQEFTEVVIDLVRAKS
jgi:hypothetical protein